MLERKPVATLSASPSPGGAARAHADLRKILEVIGAEVRGEPIAVPPAHEQLHANQPADVLLRERIRSLISMLLARAQDPALIAA